jgi:Gas vesicle protein
VAAERRASRSRRRRVPAPAERILGAADPSLLDLVDHVLNQGVVLAGDVVLGLANVDLVYLRVNALLSSADRLLTAAGGRSRSRRG